MKAAPNKPFKRIPWDVTPQDLKAARRKLGISLHYISDRLGPAPVILQAIEEGRLAGTPALLEAWAEILLEAPKPGFWNSVEEHFVEYVLLLILIFAATALAVVMGR